MANQVTGFPEELPLVLILADMLKSALEWESRSWADPDSEAGINNQLPGIDYPPTDSRPKLVA